MIITRPNENSALVLSVYVNASESETIFQNFGVLEVAFAQIAESNGALINPAPFTKSSFDAREGGLASLCEDLMTIVRLRTIPAIIMKEGRTPFDCLTLFAMLKGLPWNKVRELQNNIKEIAGPAYRPLFPKQTNSTAFASR